jgi:hypothetical protein
MGVVVSAGNGGVCVCFAAFRERVSHAYCMDISGEMRCMSWPKILAEILLKGTTR